MTKPVPDIVSAWPDDATPAGVFGQRVASPSRRLKLMVVFGTRPELIKLMPVIREAQHRSNVRLTTVMTSQHTDLVRPLVDLWAIPVDHDLDVMTPGQSLNDIVVRVMSRIDRLLDEVAPDVVMVQGDTSTAMAATMAAWHRRIPVAHVEAGLRTHRIDTPFPEEANRRLIGTVARFHFAPTERNAAALQAEGVPEENIHLVGNTIVDAIRLIRDVKPPSMRVEKLLETLKGQRIIVLTTHRRESFGEVLRERLRTLRRYVDERPDVSVVFPVHPNPQVLDVAYEELSGHPRIHLLDPLSYPDFLHCLAASWVILSDSGGIQEEAPTLGKPLLILRPETERPEAVSCGVARIVGQSIERLQAELLELDRPGSWATRISATDNPFGKGDSARRILGVLLKWKAGRAATRPAELVS